MKVSFALGSFGESFWPAAPRNEVCKVPTDVRK